MRPGLEVWACAGLGLLGVLGLLALCSPRWFTAIATGSSRWIDTEKLLAPLNKSIVIDQYVLPHCRILGLAVLVATALLTAVYIQVNWGRTCH